MLSNANVEHMKLCFPVSRCIGFILLYFQSITLIGFTIFNLQYTDFMLKIDKSQFRIKFTRPGG